MPKSIKAGDGTIQMTDYVTEEDKLYVWDLDPKSSELFAVAGPADDLSTDEARDLVTGAKAGRLPNDWRWIHEAEWSRF